VWPDAVNEIIRKLETMNGGIIGLVGPQGVGKSSALLAILSKKVLLQIEEYDKKHKSGVDANLGKDILRSKWRRKSELMASLLNGTHELSKTFRIGGWPSHLEYN
jgi:ATPase subunit of ABC transporter with duplicated ATPase domains